MDNSKGTPPRALAIALHDVCPKTWDECQRLLDLVSSISPAAPVTLLVVPRFHGDPDFSGDLNFRGALEARVARGDELALHGWSHSDDGPAPGTLREWFARRMLTAGEAEFATLSEPEATRRIEAGLQQFRSCGWTPAGFVPPAWQISAAALRAASAFSGVLRYTTTLNYLQDLRTGARIAVPCLGYSARSAVRRAASLAWNRLQSANLRNTPLLRVALHPIDARYRSTFEGWRKLIAQLLQDRRPVTKLALLQLAAPSPRHQRPMMPRREPVS